MTFALCLYVAAGIVLAPVAFCTHESARLVFGIFFPLHWLIAAHFLGIALTVGVVFVIAWGVTSIGLATMTLGCFFYWWLGGCEFQYVIHFGLLTLFVGGSFLSAITHEK